MFDFVLKTTIKSVLGEKRVERYFFSASLTSRSEHLPIVFMQYQQKLNWGPAVLPSEFIPQDGAVSQCNVDETSLRASVTQA